jgi:predicted  nucleic acid-binding Zn-ribbon protein
MAENFDKFSIGIDADVSALQSKLKSAQNTLAQFEGALKKATNIGEINYLTKNIDNLKGRINILTQEANKLGRPMGDATNALTNFSRIAQDAPYGMIGITNNLNPMLESFQRLAKTEGGTKKALQAMAAGLTGPAGIGIALAVVSSLVVAFGDDIGVFIDKATGGSASLREFANSFTGAKTAFSDAYIQIENVNSAFEKFKNGTLTKKDALDEYNNSLGKVYGTTKDIAEAERLFIENKDNYVKAALYRAAAQIALKKASEEAFKQLEAQTAPENANKVNLFMGEGLGAFALSKLTGGPSISASDIIGSEAIAKKAKTQEQVFKTIFNQFNQLAQEQDKAAVHSKDFGKELDKSLKSTDDKKSKSKTKVAIDALKEYSATLKYELSQQLMDIQKYQKIFKDKGFDNALILTYGDKGETADRKRKMAEERKRVTGQDNSLGSFLGKDAANRMKIWKQESDAVDAASKAYENFASLLANNVTNGLMSVFDAMEQGKNPLDAIGQIFVNIAKSIAAAVIQATIFEAILTAFPELKAIFRASGALQSAFGYSGPRATGGITNGPSMALIGEAGPEAVIPLSKLSGMLNTTFNAGAMSGGGGMSSGGSFVLRGNDLVLALQRSNSSLNLRRGGI